MDTQLVMPKKKTTQKTHLCRDGGRRMPQEERCSEGEVVSLEEHKELTASRGSFGRRTIKRSKKERVGR